MLCKGSSVTPIDARLYLPAEWVNDRERCLAAKVPPEKIIFKTKDELALDMVDNARKLGVKYKWVGADAGYYGKGLGFCLPLEERQQTFVVDIHSTQFIFTENPNPYLPSQNRVGRKTTLYKTDAKGIRVDKWVAAQPKSSWRNIVLRRSTKGDLTYEFLSTNLWVWQKGTSIAKKWRLIVRRDPGTHSEYKYSLSNVHAWTSLKRLAYMQSQRSWIERGLEDAKSECGMADYQLRGWVGWHHHIALVMMAMLFMCKERLINKEEYPLLSCSDIETLLASFLPRRNTTTEEVFRQMEFRHKQRQASIDSAARRKNQRKAHA
jgi:SRSO17 transposase